MRHTTKPYTNTFARLTYAFPLICHRLYWRKNDKSFWIQWQSLFLLHAHPLVSLFPAMKKAQKLFAVTVFFPLSWLSRPYSHIYGATYLVLCSRPAANWFDVQFIVFVCVGGFCSRSNRTKRHIKFGFLKKTFFFNGFVGRLSIQNHIRPKNIK